MLCVVTSVVVSVRADVATTVLPTPSITLPVVIRIPSSWDMTTVPKTSMAFQHSAIVVDGTGEAQTRLIENANQLVG